MSGSPSLEARVALVTGGSRGIGAATVRLLAQAGAKVVFNYQKAREAAEKLVQECGSSESGKDHCHAVACNLTGIETAQALVAAPVQRFGRLAILVANHGVWPEQDIGIDAMSAAQWR